MTVAPTQKVEATALFPPSPAREGTAPSPSIPRSPCRSVPLPVVPRVPLPVGPPVRTHIFGISTESTRYTVAFAVLTPPQTTEAEPLTFRLSPEPVTFTVPP
jgi:hypothetical protein